MAPITDRNYGIDTVLPVASTLVFSAPHALPAGRLAVFASHTDGAPQLLGETQLHDVPQSERINFTLGNAFDLVGERTQTDFTLDRKHHTLDENFRIKVRNHSTQPHPVIVAEHLYRWHTWEIVQTSTPFKKRTADTIDFKIDIPANSETYLTYTVRYRWAEPNP